MTVPIPSPDAAPVQSDQTSVDLTTIHRVDELEVIARSQLPAATYDYVAGGAGDEHSVRRNRDALAKWLVVPRVMVDVAEMSTHTTVVRDPLDLPLLIAPMAMHRLAHPDGELATARAAASVGVPMVLSMNSSTQVEDVAAQGARLWMQMYCSADRGHVQSIVERAAAAGCRAICVTVDHAGTPTRPRELRTPIVIPEHVDFAHLPPEPIRKPPDPSLTWDTVDWFRSITDLPIVLKGVLNPEDAVRAADCGVNAIIVSNHGGRQLDGVVSAYDMLPAIKDVVGDRLDILADGGIRSGTDLLKALALGARAGLVGRPVWWGLAVAGQAGVARVLQLIRQDFASAMALAGVQRADVVNADLVTRAD